MGTHGVKVVLIFPRPHDEEAFEKAYLDEHVPTIETKMKGVTRLVLAKVNGSTQGKVAAYRISELYFSSMRELQSCIESDGGKAVIAHAQSLSSGGQPLILICEEESFVYW